MIIEGTTKSGIDFKLDDRIKDDARLLYLLTQINKCDPEEDAMKASQLSFSLFELIFGSGEGLSRFMDTVASVHGGVCKTGVLLDEIREMLEVLNIKNS